jgi:hypothetical protein
MKGIAVIQDEGDGIRGSVPPDFLPEIIGFDPEGPGFPCPETPCRRSQCGVQGHAEGLLPGESGAGILSAFAAEHHLVPFPNSFVEEGSSLPRQG